MSKSVFLYPPLGTCSVCGDSFAMKKDGTMWTHGPKDGHCSGSSKTPRSSCAGAGRSLRFISRECGVRLELQCVTI